MLFLCYTLCFNSVLCYFNSVAMHIFDGSLRMHPTKRGHLFCKKKLVLPPNSAKRERLGLCHDQRFLLMHLSKSINSFLSIFKVSNGKIYGIGYLDL